MIKNLSKIIILFLALAIPLASSLINAQTKTAPSILVNQVDSLNNLSFSLRSSNPMQTIIIGKQANRLANQAKYRKGLLMSLSFIGVGYRNLYDYSSALDYYLQAFHLADSLEDTEQKAYALNNIGNLYYRQKKDSLAIKSINEALVLGKEMNDDTIIAYCYLNLGRIYAQKENWDETIFYLNKAVKVREKLKDDWSLANTYIEIGTTAIKMNEYENANKSFETALRLANNIENGQSIVAEAYIGFATIARDQKQYQKSIEFINKSIAVNKKIQHTEKMVESYNMLFENYASLGEYNKAYQVFKTYDSYKDSLSSDEASKTIANLEIKYETDKKERDNVLLRQQNQLKELKIAEQKSYSELLTIVIGLVLIIALFLLGIMRQKTKMNKMLQHKNDEIEKQREELANLNITKDKFFSIISHDLKSPFTGLLGSVSMLDDIYDELTDEERKEILTGMHKSTKTIQELLVGLLEWARSQQDGIELKPENINISEMTDSLFSVYKSISEKKKITMQNQLAQDLLVYTDKNVLNTILRNLIANAIKFTKESGVIKIYNDIKDGIVKITVEDNGIGISEENIDKLFRIDQHITTKGTANEGGTGLGLILCHELITKQGSTLDVESILGEGSKFSFTVPIHRKETSELDQELINQEITENS